MKKIIRNMLDMIRARDEYIFSQKQVDLAPRPDKSGVDATGHVVGAPATPKPEQFTANVATYDRAGHRQGYNPASPEEVANYEHVCEETNKLWEVFAGTFAPKKAQRIAKKGPHTAGNLIKVAKMHGYTQRKPQGPAYAPHDVHFFDSPDKKHILRVSHEGYMHRTLGDDSGEPARGFSAKKLNRHLAGLHGMKEEVVLDEAHMSDEQKSHREDIVHGMKKSKAELKARYGDRWKNVMYATATARAMGEEKIAEKLESGKWELTELTEEVLTEAKKKGKVKTVNLGKKGKFKVHKGALHRALGVPEGQKIPASKLAAASHSKSSHVRHMAASAKGFKAMHHEWTLLDQLKAAALNEEPIELVFTDGSKETVESPVAQSLVNVFEDLDGDDRIAVAEKLLEGTKNAYDRALVLITEGFVTKKCAACGQMKRMPKGDDHCSKCAAHEEGMHESADEPSCPNCGHHNAMLSDIDHPDRNKGDFGNLKCRDCGYKTHSKHLKDKLVSTLNRAGAVARLQGK